MNHDEEPARWPVRLAAASGCAALVLAAACGSSPSSSPTTTKAPKAPSSTAASSSTTTTAAAATTVPGGATPVYEVRTGTVKGLGTVLVNGQGLTLYLFVPDKQSGRSTCYGACANAWPPLVLPSGTTTPLAGPGADSSLLGTTKRTDGTVQVTYDRWPLYTWAGDSEPGQATGQGLNNLGGLWYVVAPDGHMITTKVSS